MAHANVYFYAAAALGGLPHDTLKMEDFKGKVLLITNVACEWGLTKTNYEQLNQLYDQYHDQGLEIIAQPCNQFGSQEPLSGKDLHNHLQSKWKPKFLSTFFERADVNGNNASELFKYLQTHKNCPGLLGFNGIKWNFTKFLVGRDGVPIKRYGPKDEPKKAEKDIVKALAVKEEL